MGAEETGWAWAGGGAEPNGPVGEGRTDGGGAGLGELQGGGWGRGGVNTGMIRDRREESGGGGPFLQRG